MGLPPTKSTYMLGIRKCTDISTLYNYQLVHILTIEIKCLHLCLEIGMQYVLHTYVPIPKIEIKANVCAPL